MNIKFTQSENDGYLDGAIEFIADIYENHSNPTITLRKNESNEIGIHLTGWDCKESIDVFTGNQILELLETLFQANTFLNNMKIDTENGQMNLFEKNEHVREN